MFTYIFRKVCFWRPAERDKGKKIEWLAKRGWRTVAEIGAYSKLFRVVDDVRTKI